MTEKKINHSVPLWLMKLPPGNYTLFEICDITKQKKNNVYIRMRYLDVPKKKANRYGYSFYEYAWKGAQHYIDLAWERKCQTDL